MRQSEVMGERPTIELWGVGSKVSKRLSGLGIHTVHELAAADPAVLVGEFGPRMGQWYADLGHGRGSSVVPTTGLSSGLIFAQPSGVNYTPSAAAGGGGGGLWTDGAIGRVVSNNHIDPVLLVTPRLDAMGPPANGGVPTGLKNSLAIERSRTPLPSKAAAISRPVRRSVGIGGEGVGCLLRV